MEDGVDILHRPAPRGAIGIFEVLENGHARPEHSEIEEERQSEMRGQAVLGDPRYTLRFDVTVVQPGFDHVPAHGALCPDEEGETKEASCHGPGDLLTDGEIGERTDECDADESAEDAVAPFPEEDTLEVVEGDCAVQTVGRYIMSYCSVRNILELTL